MASRPKCFIAASGAADIRPLQDALSQRGVEFVDLHALEESLFVPEAISEAISRSDFLCLVVTRQSETPNVWFEAGIAYAQKLPILVFAESPPQLPTAAQGWEWVTTTLANSAAVGLHLDAFLRKIETRATKGSADAHRAKKSSRRATKSQTTGTDLAWAKTEFRQIIDSSPVTFRGQAIEHLIARLLQGAGFSVVTSPVEGEKQVDLAVWVDELQPESLNPIYIEVKAGELSEGLLRDAEAQLSSFVLANRGGLGLLVYWDTREREFEREERPVPITARTSLPRLIEQIEKGTFVARLLSQRNSALHP